MASIVKADIKALFLRMTGLGATTAYDGLVDMAYAKICSLAEGRELTSDEADGCEYAAAADAAYAYILENASKDELVMTEQGAVRRISSDTERIADAKLRRDTAFSQLAGVIRDEGFIFMAIKG
jgi:hypothetical protein